MIVPDLNLLVYAYDASSTHHQAAAEWWSAALSGSEAVLLPSVVALGFVRLVTHARVFEHPMTVSEAVGHVRAWLGQPCVLVPDVGAAEVELVLSLLEELGMAGNLVTDAQLAATALRHQAVLYTADADFLRFQRLRWHNPLTGASSRGRQR